MNAIRDPVHGWIKFNNDEKKIIDSPFLQRLRRITQLSLADEVFPGGNHSRFIHSLGVMKMAGKYMKQLLNNTFIKLNDGTLLNSSNAPVLSLKQHEKDFALKLARVAGLCHDIGHGAYSHAWDRSVYSHIHSKDINEHYPDGGHDIHRLLMVKHPLLAQPLKEANIDPEEIIKVWEAKPSDGLYFIIKTVIGGPLGADRIDFVLRDSYFSGTQHLGTIASDRIISNSLLIKSQQNDLETSSIWDHNTWQICYKEKCINDIIQALDGRRFMYQDVYFHKTVMAATLLIEKMFEHAIHDLDLIEETVDLHRFVFSNEHTLVGKIMSLPQNHPSRICCEKLFLRKLPKMKINMILPVSQTFDEEKWKTDHPECTFMKTRPITGIDPVKFDSYNIGFITKKENIISCSELLSNLNFTAIEPYYIVRGYVDS